MVELVPSWDGTANGMVPPMGWYRNWIPRRPDDCNRWASRPRDTCERWTVARRRCKEEWKESNGVVLPNCVGALGLCRRSWALSSLWALSSWPGNNRSQVLTIPQVQQPTVFKRFVEVGRVVLVNNGPSAGSIAVIAEIIDHNRALIDGPTSSVPRQQIMYRNLILTPYTLASLPRGAGSGAIKKAIEKAGVTEKWEASGWAKKLAARQVRKNSSDFARFEIMLAKKGRRDVVRKAHYKEKKASA
ncbi:large subunit ribosomal protein L14e, partial [Tremellales sp. Uapishka_1]